mmetsp:Transcript_12506/g.25981  ORF Transcript_12506/g.25981 Transcript_12506/m.25981 type:complete len:253 (+) Transcript_12506:198-956(+)
MGKREFAQAPRAFAPHLQLGIPVPLDLLAERGSQPPAAAPQSPHRSPDRRRRNPAPPRRKGQVPPRRPQADQIRVARFHAPDRRHVLDVLRPAVRRGYGRPRAGARIGTRVDDEKVGHTVRAHGVRAVHGSGSGDEVAPAGRVRRGAGGVRGTRAGDLGGGGRQRRGNRDRQSVVVRVVGVRVHDQPFQHDAVGDDGRRTDNLGPQSVRWCRRTWDGRIHDLRRNDIQSDILRHNGSGGVRDFHEVLRSHRT